MTDYAMHSPNDGELLIRLHDELVRHGMKSDKDWNRHHNPLEELHLAEMNMRDVYFYTIYLGRDKAISYHNHKCATCGTHHDLTPENFQTVLNEVLQNFGIEYRNP